jgi:hypothetical protein
MKEQIPRGNDKRREWFERDKWGNGYGFVRYWIKWGLKFYDVYCNEKCSLRWRVREGILKINWKIVASWSDQYLAVNK